jgi:formylglycine-generating enzyme required for sulfatase activity
VILVPVDPVVPGSPSEPFLVAPHPVTYAQWDRYCVENALERPHEDFADDHPVVTIGIGSALTYCNWLSREQDLRPCYELVWTRYDGPERGVRVEASHRFADDRGGYRLPTTQEWLWAARGGLRSRNTRYAGSDDLDEVAWHAGNAGRRTHPVGQKKPNELGLYDMTGNVTEACVAQTDPLSFVCQGGAWPSSFERALTLGEVSGNFQMGNVWGFRVVRTARSHGPGAEADR